MGHDDLPRLPADCGVAALLKGVVGHLQGAAVVGDHPLQKPAHATLAAGGCPHHAHRLDLLRRHAHQIGQGIGITTRLPGHRVERRLRIPGLAPLAHRLDLLGLVGPDCLGQGPHPALADVEHEFAHAQRSGVVLHHRVEPAQVVGGAGWSEAGAVLVAHRCGRRRTGPIWRGRRVVIVVRGGALGLGPGRQKPRQRQGGHHQGGQAEGNPCRSSHRKHAQVPLA